MLSKVMYLSKEYYLINYYFLNRSRFKIFIWRMLGVILNVFYRDSDGQYIEPEELCEEVETYSQNCSFLVKSKIKTPCSSDLKISTTKKINRDSPKIPSSITFSMLPSPTDSKLLFSLFFRSRVNYNSLHIYLKVSLKFLMKQ